MKRCLYRAQCRHGAEEMMNREQAIPELKERMSKHGAEHLSLFRWGQQLFLYYECPNEAADPHELLAHMEDDLVYWPGGDPKRQWVPMMDIFHYQSPVSQEHWQRPHGPRVPYARLARLKPEYVSSYIFYHYQYQEEKPGDGDKYGIIGLNENLLFFYCERPTTLEQAPYEGKLDTSLTPADWGATMSPHFQMWERLSPTPHIPWLGIEMVLQA